MDTKGIGAVVVLLFLGLFLGAIGMLPAYEHNVAVQESVTTTGTVQSTHIEVSTDDDGDETYTPVVVYQYSVDGETYTSENTFPGRFSRGRSSRSWAESVVGDYSSGEAVTVHYVPYDPANAYVRNDGLPQTWYIGLAYVVIAGFGGVWLVRQGFRRWRQRQLIADTPTETVRSLSVGRSELKGTAVTQDRSPLPAPFSDDECVVATYEIEEYEEDDDGGNWKTIEEDVLYVPFFVDDDTGSVLVEPHDDALYDLEPDDWTETYVDSSERGPEPIREFVSRTDGLSFPSSASGKENDRKYRQNLIRPGESVYVLGPVRPDREADGGARQEDHLVVTYDEDDELAQDGMYMISDDTEANLVDRREWALWRAPVGGFFLTVGLVFLIGMFGPSVGLTLPVVF